MNTKKNFDTTGYISGNLSKFFNDVLQNKILEQKGNFEIAFKAISLDGQEAKIGIKEIDPKYNTLTAGYHIKFSQEDNIIHYNILGKLEAGVQALGEALNVYGSVVSIE